MRDAGGPAAVRRAGRGRAAGPDRAAGHAGRGIRRIGRFSLIVRFDQLAHGPPGEQRHGPAPPGPALPGAAPPVPAPGDLAPPILALPGAAPPAPGSPLAKIVDLALVAARREAA